MAVIGTQVATLADVASRLDKDGKIPKIVEMLAKTNAVLDDAPAMQCNNGTTHKTVIRTGIPQATWRLLNRGVDRVKTTTAAVEEATGMLEAYAEVDKRLVDIAENGESFRVSEAVGVAEGMSQQVATALWYGGRETPERFLGFAPRFATLDPAKAESARQVIDAGGTGSTNTSAWLITWGENTAHLLYPKGSKAGLSHENKGQVTLFDENNKPYEGYRDHWQWDIGLAVRDYRYISRVANIDVSQMTADATYLKGIIRHFILASEQIQSTGMGKTVWYVNRQLRGLFRLAILEKVATNLTWETVAGKRFMMFDEYPVHMSEALLSTEARVTV